MDAKDALGEPTAFISRSALLHNASLIRRQLKPGTKICAVVKADAYGHDANLVVDALANFATDDAGTPSVDAFAVADLDEAAALPSVPQPLLILRPVENAFLGRQRHRIELAIRSGWSLTIASPAAADDVARIATMAGKRALVQIMLDTGMNRAGVGVAQFERLVQKIDSRPELRLAGLYTHFVNGESPDDPINIEQMASFLDATDPLMIGRSTRPLRHAANSGAIFCTPPTQLDMVRPGLSLYGIDPTGKPSIDRPLRPALHWTAPLVGIRDVPAGSSVGYNQTWVADRDTRVGLLPVGYADGYPRSFSNRAVTLLHGCVAPVVGRVSMDFTTIDLTQVPLAAVGDVVTLLDPNPLSPASIYQLAAWENTIPYEILCRIGSRVRRVAIDPSDGREAVATSAEDEESATENGES